MPIRVLLVEDSPVALAILKRILASSPEIEVVGVAGTGKEGLTLLPQVKPDVICTDLHMPEMNGLEFTAEVMATYPRPILVVSASVQQEDTRNVFQLLEAGAVDVFPKPRAWSGAEYEQAKQELLSKIKILSGVAVFTQHRRRTGEQNSQGTFGGVLRVEDPESRGSKSNSPGRAEAHRQGTEELRRANKSYYPLLSAKSKVQNPLSSVSNIQSSVKLIAIGASTGGPQALHTILTQLPSNFPVPVICVQHISEGFLQGLVDWLAAECPLPVKIATAGEVPHSGTVYFPAERLHLEFDEKGRFSYSASPPVGGHRPSITVTFNSVASCYGRASVGILLTGMGRDGADGMRAIAQAGGQTIAQNETSCVVFGMPKEAIALGAAQYILPITEISAVLINKILPKKI